MLKSKYSKPILYFICYCIFILILSIVLSISIPRQNLTYLIPIRDIGFEVGLIFILILPFSSILGFTYKNKEVFPQEINRLFQIETGLRILQ